MNKHLPGITIDTSGVSKLLLAEEGVAGTTRVSLHHDVILGVDTWDPSQLNELIVLTPSADPNWNESQIKLIHQITAINADNYQDFLQQYSRSAASISLFETVRRLATAENLRTHLSDIYALESLYIEESNPALLRSMAQIAEPGLSSIADMYFEAALPNREFSVDLFSEAVLDCYGGKSPELPKFQNTRTFASLLRESLTPAYPVPKSLHRPMIPNDAILIDDFDVNCAFVNRAWFTVTPDQRALELNALVEFDDVEVFASVVDGRDYPRVQLHPTTERIQDLVLYRTKFAYSQDSTRVEIHDTLFDESSTRNQRAENFAKEIMANVAARMQTVIQASDFANLSEADPTLQTDIEKSRLIFKGIANRSDLANRCDAILRTLTAFSFDESLFSSWVRVQTVEVVRRLLSITNDQELPEIADINETSNWNELREAAAFVKRFSAASMNPSLVDQFEPQREFAKFRSNDLASRYKLSPSTPGGFLNRFSRSSKDNQISNLNFESDGEDVVDQLAVELAAQTEKLQEISRFLREGRTTNDVDFGASSSRSQRGSSLIPRPNSVRQLINKLRIAQSTN
jgi:hypothetical protein